MATQLSSVLREVEAGKRVTVVEDGRPVAELVPPMPERSKGMKNLIAEGKVTPAKRPASEAPPPKPRYTGRSATAIILAEREEDR